MKFFFDNQLSPHLANAIHCLVSPDGHEVVHLRDKFKQNISDEVWISALGKEGGWIVICGDLNIVRTKAQIPIWKAAKITGFFLKKGWINLQPFDQAWRLIKIWSPLMNQANLATPGSTFGVPVSANGKFETL